MVQAGPAKQGVVHVEERDRARAGFFEHCA
jgi:hypothetical protein